MNQLLRLPIDHHGLCQLEIDNQTVRLPVKALELLHYHPVTIDAVEALPAQPMAIPGRDTQPAVGQSRKGKAA